MRRASIIAVGVVVAWILGAWPARACSCSKVSRVAHRRHADVIATGVLERVYTETPEICGGGIYDAPSHPVPEPPEATPVAGTGCVRGVVRYPLCGTTLPGVTVRIDGAESWTGSDGAFEICGVSPGTQMLVAGRYASELDLAVEVVADGVTEVELDIEERESNPELLMGGRRWAVLRVTAASKGARRCERVLIWTSVSSCGYRFEEGKRWRFFATRDDQTNHLWAGNCSPSRSLGRRKRRR